MSSYSSNHSSDQIPRAHVRILHGEPVAAISRCTQQTRTEQTGTELAELDKHGTLLETATELGAGVLSTGMLKAGCDAWVLVAGMLETGRDAYGVAIGVGVRVEVSVTVTVTGDSEVISITVLTDGDGSGVGELSDSPATLTTEYGGFLRMILLLISFGIASETQREGRAIRRAADVRCMAQCSRCTGRLLFQGGGRDLEDFR